MSDLVMAYCKESGMWEGFIYCIENKVNGKKYIGQTIQTVHLRWKDHLRSYQKNKNNLYLYVAMNKYSADKFAVNELNKVVAETKQEVIDCLNELEIKLISEMNTMQPNGYNMAIGGYNTPNTWAAKEVFQFNSDGQFVSKYDSIADAAKITGVSHSDISSCANGKLKMAGFYIWQYNNIPPSRIESTRNQVKQYNLNGDLINTHNSIIGACNSKSSASAIIRCCNGKAMSHNGSVWRFIEDGFTKYKTPEIKCKIIQYTLDMNYVDSYNSVPEIVDRYGFDMSSLYKSLNHGRAHRNYIWQYENNPQCKAIRRRKSRNKVYVYNLDGVLLNEFPSVRQCSLFYNICNHRISKCCKGKFDSVDNLVFKYNKLSFDIA